MTDGIVTIVEVELPHCRVCGHVGKIPVGNAKHLRSFCEGQSGRRHTREKMIPLLFTSEPLRDAERREAGSKR